VKREIKFRLIFDDKIVGYKKHSFDSAYGILHSADMKSWYNINVKDNLKKWIWHTSKEQYTGLVGLCENDIIEIVKENDDDHGFYLPVGSKYVVVWDDLHGGFCLSSIERYLYNTTHDNSQIDHDYYGLVSENIEMPITYYSKIIGNIHEETEK